jgi:hypothetical protein
VFFLPLLTTDKIYEPFENPAVLIEGDDPAVKVSEYSILPEMSASCTTQSFKLFPEKRMFKFSDAGFGNTVNRSCSLNSSALSKVPVVFR